MYPGFQYNQYLLKRQVLALTGKVRLYEPGGQLVIYCEQKMFRLREDIRAYRDESKSQEVLLIKARQIIDFSAAYDVVDPIYNQQIGTLRRKGWRSLVQDEWEVLDPSGQIIAILREDNLTRALLRRFLLGTLLPQDYDLVAASSAGPTDVRLADLKQRFNLFRYELDLDFSMDPAQRVDRRLGIAAGILLAIIEGKQES